jgi:ubiquinone/menaquinone biosynthesis C-methylase UbiE
MKILRILNVGCGKQTYGTDFIDVYPSRPEVKKCNIDNEKLPYPNNTFDEVYSRCLLEHTKNVFNVLKEMIRVLKPKGKLVIITDNAGYLFYYLFTPHGNYFDKKEDRHYVLFQKEHLRNFLHDLNLKIDSIEYVYWEWGKKSIKYYFVTFFNVIFRRIKPTFGYPWIKAIAIKKVVK